MPDSTQRNRRSQPRERSGSGSTTPDSLNGPTGHQNDLTAVQFRTVIQGCVSTSRTFEWLSACLGYKVVQYLNHKSPNVVVMELRTGRWECVGHGPLGVGYPLYHDSPKQAFVYLASYTNRRVVQPELPLPTNDTRMRDASFTQAPLETRVMRVDRGDAIALLKAVGFKAKVEKFTDAELSAKLSKFPKLDLEEPESKQLKTLLDDVLNAAEQEEGIVITDADEEKEAEREESVAKSGSTKTVNKTKNKAAATEVAQETNGVHVHATDRWRLIGPAKVVKVTSELAEKFRDMEKFPRERTLTKSRRDFLKGKIAAGEWRGNTWASVMVDGTTYRLNGRGSATAFCDLFAEGKEDIEAVVTVERYECDTMEQAAALWATFDPKQSARSKGNLLQAYASGSSVLVELPGQIIKLAAAGLGFAMFEKEYRKKTVENQAKLILDHDDFVEWLAKTLDVKKTDAPHVFRMPVVAAMFKTYASEPKAAVEFWEVVRDDSDDPKADPRRQLKNWLQNHSFGAPSGKSELKPANDHEGYVICLSAWNAWRAKDTKWKPEKYVAKTKTPEVS